MRILRSKQVRKALKFYRIAFGVAPPYSVLVDGNFVVIADQMKVDIEPRVQKLLQTSEIRFVTTKCVMNELDRLTEQIGDMCSIMRGLCTVQDCEHSSDTAPNACIAAVIGKSNPKKYVVATQDSELREQLRGVPGTPIFYLNRSVVVFEKPSDATKDHSFKNEVAKVGKLTDSERKEKREAWSSDKKPQQKATGKRKARGPNPLSVKKKKVEAPKSPKQQEQQSKKRNRRRRKKDQGSRSP